MSTKRILSLVLTLTLILGSFSFAFADLASPQEDKIAELVKLGYVKGDETGNLQLDRPFMRGEAATMVARTLVSVNNPSMDLDEVEKELNKFNFKGKFKDVSTENWANKYVNYSAQQGIVEGIPDYPGFIFAPENKISYQEVLTMMVRILEEEPNAGPWPGNYISKAKELGLDYGLNVKDYSKIPPRKEVFEMFYNTLYKAGIIDQVIFESMDVTANEDGLITVGAKVSKVKPGSTATITLSKAGMADIVVKDVIISAEGVAVKQIGPVDSGTYTATVTIDGVSKSKEVVVTKKALAIESVTAANAKALKVKFTKPVEDTSKANFELTKDGFKANVTSITWNSEKTEATIELTSKITKGEYTVNVTGLTDQTLTGTVKTDDEKVAKIEILSDRAPLGTDEKTAKVGYKVENQYGEDVTRLNASSLIITAAGADSATANVDGSITLTKASGFKTDDKIVITIIHPQTATTTTKTVTISNKSMAQDIVIGEIYNKDGKTLNEDIIESKDKFFLPVAIKDQYGNEITDLNRLNGTGNKEVTKEVIVTNTNPGIVTFGEFEKQTINGKEVVVLPITKVISAGETNVIIISKSTGANTSKPVRVAEGVRTDLVTLGAPTKVVTAGEDVLFPIYVQDKQGNEIKDVKVLAGNNGIKITGAEKDLVEIDGQLYVKVKADQVKKDTPLTVVVTSSTSKVATQTVIPKEATAPKVITGVNVNTAIREGSTTPIKISSNDIVVEDQYGQVIPTNLLRDKLGTNVIKAFVDADAPFTVSGEISKSSNEITVTYKAGSTRTDANVTFKMLDQAGNANESSAFSKNFSVVKDSSFESYKVEDVNPIYVDSNNAIPAGYDQDIVVKAVTNSGKEVKLKAGTDFTVRSTVLTNVVDGNIAGNDAKNIKFADNATTTTARIVVTINATGQEIVKDVTFSKVAPKVEKVVLVENNKANDYINKVGNVKEVSAAQFNPAIQGVFNLESLKGLVDIVSTDQYGVMKNVTDDVTMTLSKVSGDVTFVQNGTKDATVTNMSDGAVFNATVNSNGASATLKVTATSSYNPTPGTNKVELDKAILSANELKDKAADYTTESFGAFSSALTNAANVRQASNSTQAQIDKATADLNTAKANLVPVGNLAGDLSINMFGYVLEIPVPANSKVTSVNVNGTELVEEETFAVEGNVLRIGGQVTKATDNVKVTIDGKVKNVTITDKTK